MSHYNYGIIIGANESAPKLGAYCASMAFCGNAGNQYISAGNVTSLAFSSSLSIVCTHEEAIQETAMGAHSE